MRTLAARAAGLGLAALVIAACTGVPDSRFGTGGLQVLPEQLGAPQLVLLPRGRITAASYGANGSAVVSRLNPDGTPDRAYATRGRLVIAHRAAQTLGPDGRFYVIDGQAKLTAFTADGKPDAAFGSVSLPYATGLLAEPPVIAPDGDIYISPRCETGCTVWRYKRDGTQDAGFVYRGGTRATKVQATVSGGSAYVSSTSVGGRGVRYTLQRLTSTGALDPTFATGGRLTLPPGVRIASVVVDRSNRILLSVARVGSNGRAIAPYLLRLTSRGEPDTSFGWLGIAAVPGSAGLDGGPLTVDPKGRAVTAPVPDDSFPPLRVYRFSAEGTLDPTFGINGVSTVSGIRGRQIIGMWTSALTVDSAGTITVGTGVDIVDGDPRTAVVRLTG